MKDYFISMFIDNELDLDEKVEFVEEVHKNAEFKNQTVDLLEQEKLLQTGIDELEVKPPVLSVPTRRQIKSNFFKSWVPAFAGFSTACLLLLALFFTYPLPTEPETQLRRFVIYQPDAEHPEIIGNFTNWVPVTMTKIGDSGYWSISIELPAGEYHYSYLLENGRQIADPTVLEREKDDFGGENSIIKVAAAI